MIEAQILQILSNMSLGALSVLLGYGFMYQVMIKIFMPMISKIKNQNDEIKELIYEILKKM